MTGPAHAKSVLCQSGVLRPLLFLIALSLACLGQAQSFEWRDVEQRVDIRPDGTVLVEDERTLTTGGDFGEAFICLNLESGQSVTLLEGSGVVSGPAEGEAYQQSCDGGQELVVRHEQRVSESRVLFRYRLEGSVDAYGDVVQWYWNILELDHPPIRGYTLEVRAPGPMEEPYDAFVHRYSNSEEPDVALSDDRSLLTVRFDRIPDGDGVEIRYLMDPRLFEITGSGERMLDFLEEEADIAGVPLPSSSSSEGPPLWTPLAIVLAVIGYLLFGVYGAYRRVGREPEGAPTMQYPFEPPRNMPPAAVTAILKQNPNLNPSSYANTAFFATVMDLARRGYGRFETEKKDFSMTLDLSKDTTELLDFERGVLEYLQKAAASGGNPRELDKKTLRKYSQKRFRSFVLPWVDGPREWLEGQVGGPLITEESRKATSRWTTRSILAAIALFLVGMLGGGPIAFVGAAACIAILLVTASTVPAWREDIVDEVRGWQGFKRTLSDYTIMRDAPNDFFKLWDRYYCYAAALGVAQRYLKNIGKAIEERNLDSRSYMRQGTWMGSSVANASDLGSMGRSISQLSSALSSAGASASSGGSSSGGGGGGGGGSSGGR